jgi:hypothetical protein
MKELSMSRTVTAIAALLASSTLATAATTTIVSSHDNTLYESDIGHLSNGAGEWFFAGKTFTSKIRRGLVRFDLTGIPSNAVISSATLTLYHSLGQPAPANVAVHRALASWGEGTSNPKGNEGSGIDATPGDATWLHTFFDTSFWTTPGGDFVTDASATTSVGPDYGFYAWSGDNLTSDVQAWVDGSAANAGWILIGDEVLKFGSAKRFSTNENPVEAERPTLIVEWSIFGDFDGDGSVGAADLAILLGAWETAGPTDLDGDGTTGASDLALLLGAWSV